MGRNVDKLLLLIWKNCILRIRNPESSVVEIIFILILPAILVLVRLKTEFNDAITYNKFCPLTPEMSHNILSEGLVLCDPKANNTDPDLPQLPNFSSLTFMYVPNTSAEINRAMELFRPVFGNVVGLVDTEAMNKYYRSSSSEVIAGGIVFKAKSGNLKNLANIEVQIRFPSELRVNITEDVDNWKTKEVFPQTPLPGPRDSGMNTGSSPSYYGEGFLAVQYVTVTALTLVKNNIKPDERNEWIKTNYPYVNMRRFAFNSWYSDPGMMLVSINFALFVTVITSLPLENLIRTITIEKEKQLKESMKIMGLSSGLHWSAWFLSSFLYLGILAGLAVLTLKVKWRNGLAVLIYGDGTLIYMYILCCVCTSIGFSFAFSTFFSKASYASLISSLLWLVTFAPFWIFTRLYGGSLSPAAVLCISLFPGSGMSFGAQIITVYEATGDGIQWSNLFTAVYGTSALGLIMLILIMEAVLFIFIATYVEAVFPGAYGVPKPWNFLCSKNYWCGKPESDNDERDIGNENYWDGKGVFEPEPQYLQAGIKIKKLYKEFGDKVAVDDLTLNMYEDQITVLVGHNGAGKTTTMLMLTGMITPTRGTAIVNGYDIRTNIDGVRESMGLCPQHDVIFDNLTVADHLYFFGKLKGLKGVQLKTEIDKYIQKLDLKEKRNEKSSTLSGGMKRKLGVGMALCGGSKVVMLDEPSSGVDPSSRRELWNLIESEKKGRVILLTTHFMDEADVLGDRIAILSGGRLQCSGSTYFLKKKYGTGYRLNIEKARNCNVLGTQNVLKKYIPDITINSNTASELTFLLPEKYSSSFEAMLRNLEGQTAKLGIESFGVSLSTMEDVFMKTGAAEHVNVTKEAVSPNTRSRGEQIDVASTSTNNKELLLVASQFQAMFLKRFVTFKRAWFTFFFPILLPSVCLLLSLLMSTLSEEVLPPADLSLNALQNPVTLMQNEGDDYVDAYKKLLTVEMTDNITRTMLHLTKSKTAVARYQYIIGADIKATDKDRASLTAYFNHEAFHSPGTSLSLILNTIFRVKTRCKTCSIDFVNYPLEFRPENVITKAAPLFNLMTIFLMAFVGGVFSVFIIKEAVSKSKHLQFVSGLKIPIFWISHLISDLCVCVLMTALYCIILVSFQLESYSTMAAFGCVIVVFCYFSCAVLLTTYFLSYLFDEPSAGFDGIPTIYIFLALLPYFVIQFVGKDNKYTKIVEWICLINPCFEMMKGLDELYNTYIYNKLCNQSYEACDQAGLSKETCMESMDPKFRHICEGADGDYYKWHSPGILRYIVFSLSQAVVFLILLIAIELKLASNIVCFIQRTILRQRPVDVDEDNDVAREKERIRNTNQDQLLSEHVVVIKDLTKYYNNFLAANGLCLGIKESECFGLLGENGAGKSTIFSMMTAETTITYGNCWVNGVSIKSNQKKARQFLGYCPQFDALLDHMTVKETVIMIGLIRGLTFKAASDISEVLANEFDFAAHIDKKVKNLSGGNKRKLSTALTVIGDPPILYLDEPTTGVDPAAKRYIWAALSRRREAGKSIVLSSHSMEECEALCTRLVIMVEGNFKCIGSKQHLKSKFAQGYSLSIKLKKRIDSSGRRLPADTTIIEKFVSEKFPNAKLMERYEELLTYQIPQLREPWSKLFGILEKAKKDYPQIEDYSLGQCTLEQVFLKLTQKQQQ